MASSTAGRPSCPDTGLAVPECSCRRCLEAMLMEHRPTVLAEQITVRRPHAAEGPPPSRKAA